jgi:uncharacterized protein (UPF0333 family)
MKKFQTKKILILVFDYESNISLSFQLPFPIILILLHIWVFLFSFTSNIVISQVYNSELTPAEYVMKGNSGIMKCLIPSFVADFVEVTAWIDDSGNEYLNDKKFDLGTHFNI